MITSGSPKSSARKTEILDVVTGVNCAVLPDFPVELQTAVGANLDGTPVVCGGDSSEKCYRFNNGGWEEFASMKKKRGWAAAVVYNTKLHVFGGNPGKSTSEKVNLDGGVSDGPDLPTAVWFHAMTTINDTVSILTGGATSSHSYSPNTWYYNHETEVFTAGPDLLEGRRDHGSATNVDKVTKVKTPIVTGGYNGGYMKSTEMLINGLWQSGTIQCRKQNF